MADRKKVGVVQKDDNGLGVAAHTFNARTPEAETGRSL